MPFDAHPNARGPPAFDFLVDRQTTRMKISTTNLNKGPTWRGGLPFLVEPPACQGPAKLLSAGLHPARVLETSRYCNIIYICMKAFRQLSPRPLRLWVQVGLKGLSPNERHQQKTVTYCKVHGRHTKTEPNNERFVCVCVYVRILNDRSTQFTMPLLLQVFPKKRRIS